MNAGHQDEGAAITRRQTLRLAASGGAGLALGAGAAIAGAGTASAAPTGGRAAGPAAAPHHRPRPAPAPHEGQTAYVAVEAATMWTEPGIARELDAPSLSRPVDLDGWNAAMDDTDKRQWLVGNLESQALYGSRVIVDEITAGKDGREWAKIVAIGQKNKRDARGYPGWLPLEQLLVDDEYGTALDRAAYAFVVSNHARLAGVTGAHRANAVPDSLPFLVRLPVVDGGRGHHGRGVVEVRLPGGGTGLLKRRDVEVHAHGDGPATPTRADVIATGRRFLGLQYLWAGMTSYGFDCSGFSHGIFQRHGIEIPRDAGDQLNMSGFPKVDRADLEPGDLVFFATEPGGDSIRHVAMYIGDDTIMQAPNPSRSVETMSLTEYDPTGEYAGAIRILEK